jgi:hypothetical protein
MKRHLALAAAIACLCAGARAGDFDSVESITRAVYDTISGPVGPRDWVRFKGLFVEGARLAAIRIVNGAPQVSMMTPDEFAQRNGANSMKNPFYEAETARRVEEFGAIAHVFSTYESRRAPGEKPFARGINSFQLVKTAEGWKVMTILWDSEREGNPLPEKYLTASK